MKLLKKLRERKQARTEEPDPVTLPAGESKQIYGIVFTNATGSTVQIKTYGSKVVVLSRLGDGEQERT